MFSGTMSNRMKAAAIAALMCLSVAGAAVPLMYNAPDVSAATVSVGKSMKANDTYKGKFSDFKSDKITEMVITVEAPYSGNMSFGLGVSTKDDPYWLEYDGKNEKWVDTEGGEIEVPGTEVKVTKGKETEIKIDLSKADVDPKGTFEFRNYYSADWSSGKENPVAIKLISVGDGGAASSEETTEAGAGDLPTITVGKEYAAGKNYGGSFAGFKLDDIQELIVNVKAPYTGNFSYGLGVSTKDEPYWLEYDGKNEDWVDTEGGTIEVPGTEVKVTKGEVTAIKIDVSKAGINPKGTFEFRNYYSADWSSGKEKPVSIEIVSIQAKGKGTTTATTEATTKATEATTKATEATTKATEATTEPTTKATEPTTKATEATEPTKEAAKVTLYGDLNADKDVNIMDVIAVNKYLLGLKDLDDQALANADVNADSKVQSDDGLHVLKLALEMEKQADFPVKK